jgi:hypothetical protein
VPIVNREETTRNYSRDNEDPYRLKGIASHSPGMTPGPATTTYDEDQARYMAPLQTHAARSQQQPAQDQSFSLPGQEHLSQTPASAYQQTQPAQPFLDSPSAFQRNQSSYGDWMAPAVVGAGAGIAGTAAYNHYNRDGESELQQQAATEAALIDDSGRQVNPSDSSITTTNDAPIINDRNIAQPPLSPTADTANPPALATPIDTRFGRGGNTGTYLSYPIRTNTSTDPVASSDTPVSPREGGLGGLEARGAHETGHIFPKVVRHDTDISVSQLHVPGEFPKKV